MGSPSLESSAAERVWPSFAETTWQAAVTSGSSLRGSVGPHAVAAAIAETSRRGSAGKNRFLDMRVLSFPSKQGVRLKLGGPSWLEVLGFAAVSPFAQPFGGRPHGSAVRRVSSY